MLLLYNASILRERGIKMYNLIFLSYNYDTVSYKLCGA